MSEEAGRRGDWMPIYSGRKFWPLDPRPEDIDIHDIAHALARINRFNGHSEQTYSVAQHSILVASLCPDHQLFGLLHDASEAYLGDVISPVKRLLGRAYRDLEDGVMLAVSRRFGFCTTPEAKAAVKKADEQVLLAEYRQLTCWDSLNYQTDERPANITIVPWGPEQAEKTFLEVYRVITSLCGVSKATAATRR